MAEKPSERSPYESRFGGGFISAAQHLAESMCDRSARRSGVELPRRFWNDTRHQRDFLLQLRHANALLKTYSVEAIVRALRTSRGKTALSLGAPWLDPLFAAQERQLELDRQEAEKAAVEPPPEPPAQPEPPRPPRRVKKSILSRLREVDGQT